LEQQELMALEARLVGQALKVRPVPTVRKGQLERTAHLEKLALPAPTMAILERKEFLELLEILAPLVTREQLEQLALQVQLGRLVCQELLEILECLESLV
jgi:hypothetical protein